jgi:hypothetical protein
VNTQKDIVDAIGVLPTVVRVNIKRSMTTPHGWLEMEVYGGGYGDIYEALERVVPAGVTVAWIHHYWADRSTRYIYPEGAPAKRPEPKKCRCDIRDLMSVGHNAGCPERH